MHHHLKIWPRFFDVVQKGEKSFEVRKNDRAFAVGDTLVLEEWDPAALPTPKYTGRSTEKVVIYMLLGADMNGLWGVHPDFVVMAIR